MESSAPELHISYEELLQEAVKKDATSVVKAILKHKERANAKQEILNTIDVAIHYKTDASLRILIKHFAKYHCEFRIFSQENTLQQHKYMNVDYIDFILHKHK